jgi:hypothetical protein
MFGPENNTKPPHFPARSLFPAEMKKLLTPFLGLPEPIPEVPYSWEFWRSRERSVLRDLQGIPTLQI